VNQSNAKVTTAKGETDMKDGMLHIATYNIHKGFSQFNRRMVVHELRERLRSLAPDIVFLQEVQGLHLGHAEKLEQWPDRPQHEFLAEDVWHDTAYGGNAVYDHGHHGNAILSRFPILASSNQDISDHRLEKRGMLHCELAVPGLAAPLHCVCVHLGLLGRSRKRQMEALALRVEQEVPPEAPLIIAGDFNDWRNRADNLLCERMGVCEVFGGAVGRPARSFPAALPVFRLDRIYVRGLDVRSAQVHFGSPWSEISDHAALSAWLSLSP
jgi:endonuclease/exonuclease/phosphatase family metal-dependent hydrolase